METTINKLPYLNYSAQELMLLGSEKRNEYLKAAPFPHIYFDDFFNPDCLTSVLSEFPNLGELKEKDIYYRNANEDKYASKGQHRLGKDTLSLVQFLNSQLFLEFLQEISGIKETLIPDPYLEGGGLHQIKKEGFLKIHVDFHKHKMMNLDRRLNVIVYLNEDWEEEYNGHLELWERDMSKCAVKITPLFNRLVIFSTTDYSWHGHPDHLKCPENKSRKSLALYYYSNGRPNDEISTEKRTRITTTFASRKGKDSLNMRLYNGAVNIANDWLPPAVVKLMKKVKDN